MFKITDGTDGQTYKNKKPSFWKLEHVKTTDLDYCM